MTTVSLLLLLCIAAQLSYVDHVIARWMPVAGDAAELQDGHDHSHQASASTKTVGIHSLHCHGGLATCSELPLAAGPGQIVFSHELLMAAVMSSFDIGLVRDFDTPSEVSLAPHPRPPRLIP